MASKQFMVTYLLYFFLAQPLVGFYFPDWCNGGQVFQLVEEEDSGQSRFLEERIGDEIPSYNHFIANTSLHSLSETESYYLDGFYKVITLEIPNPPPEQAFSLA